MSECLQFPQVDYMCLEPENPLIKFLRSVQIAERVRAEQTWQRHRHISVTTTMKTAMELMITLLDTRLMMTWLLGIMRTPGRQTNIYLSSCLIKTKWTNLVNSFLQERSCVGVFISESVMNESDDEVLVFICNYPPNNLTPTQHTINDDDLICTYWVPN